MAWLSGRVRPGEATLMEALGFVFVCGGLASWLGASYLLACIVLGGVVAWRAKHHTRPVHAIEGISEPFLVVFFVLAGLSLDFEALRALGVVGALYVGGRVLGKLSGAWLGARIAGAPAQLRRYAGTCLLPQAGVALGLGLMAAERFPEYGPRILSLLVGTTVVFEMIGPLATRAALQRAGELRAPR
jgi:Kef-type K+ transport system membrane component KefB